MRVHVDHDPTGAFRVVDKTTDEVVPYVRWADTDTHEIGVVRCDDRGIIVDNPGDPAGFFEDVSTNRQFRIVLWNWDGGPYEVLAETA